MEVTYSLVDVTYTRFFDFPCERCGGDHDQCLTVELPCPECGTLASWFETVSYMQSDENIWEMVRVGDGMGTGITLKTTTTTIESITCPCCDA